MGCAVLKGENYHRLQVLPSTRLGHRRLGTSFDISGSVKAGEAGCGLVDPWRRGIRVWLEKGPWEEVLQLWGVLLIR